jgi:purine nucleosidase
LKRAKQLLIMGGAARCPGNVTPHAEFNFHADALAAHTVLNAGATVTLFGLDVTSQAVMSNEWINSLPAHLHCGGAAHQMLVAYADEDPLLHDACPVAFLIEPQLFTGEVCAVAVDYRPGPTEGLLTVDKPARVPNSAVAHVITQVNCENLLALVHGSISRLR